MLTKFNFILFNTEAKVGFFFEKKRIAICSLREHVYSPQIAKLYYPNKRQYPTHHNLKTPTVFNLHSKFLKYNLGLVASESGIITAAQLTAAVLILKRKGNKQLLVRTFPHLPVSKRPPELPLGKGKANVQYWATTIKAGSLIFELNYSIATKLALISASYKLPFKTEIVINSDSRRELT